MAASERELIAGIVAAPDDDEPRLVYADWLQERGDVRGELVVDQCALARAEAADAPIAERAPIRDRVAALIAEHGEAWLEPAFAVSPMYYEFRRGMIEHADMLGDDLDGERLRDVAPVLRSVSGPRTAAPAIFAAAASLPIDEIRLSWVDDVDAITDGCAGIAGLRRLSLPALRSHATATIGGALEHLAIDFAQTGSGDAWLEQLVSHPAYAGLRSLALTNATLGDPSSLGGLRQLEHLHLGVGVVPRLPEMATITSLVVRALALEEERLDALFDALPSLRRVRVHCGTGGDDVAELFAKSPRASRLARLDLSYNRMGARGLHALVGSPHLGGLVELRVVGNELDADAVAAMRAESTLSRCDLITELVSASGMRRG